MIVIKIDDDRMLLIATNTHIGPYIKHHANSRKIEYMININPGVGDFNNVLHSTPNEVTHKKIWSIFRQQLMSGKKEIDMQEIINN